MFMLSRLESESARESRSAGHGHGHGHGRIPGRCLFARSGRGCAPGLRRPRGNRHGDLKLCNYESSKLVTTERDDTRAGRPGPGCRAGGGSLIIITAWHYQLKPEVRPAAAAARWRAALSPPLWTRTPPLWTRRIRAEAFKFAVCSPLRHRIRRFSPLHDSVLASS